MKLLYIADPHSTDASYFDQLSRLAALRGIHVITSSQKRETAAEVTLLCKQHKVDAVFTTQQHLLERALYRLPDFIPPVGRKALTLDDYAGSVIDLPDGGPELLILNPLEHLQTVPYAKFLFNRYLTKLTHKEAWYAAPDFRWTQVTELNFEDVERRLGEATLIACDIETIGDSDRSIECVGYSARFSDGTQQAFVVLFDSAWAYNFVRRVNANPVRKIFQHGQYDNAYFLRWNCPVNNWQFDTMNLIHSWYSELPKRLDFIATFALRKVRYWKDDGKTGSIEDKMRYNALDCWATLNAAISLIAEMPEWAMQNYLQEFPMNFPALHCGMEGLAVDWNAFHAAKTRATEESEKSLARIRNLLSSPNFNPRSPQQMKALFNLLGVGHLPDTAKASMLKAKAASPLNDMILTEVTDYKEDAKLLSTYLVEDKMWNGRLFYEIDPAGTDTGRAASKASFFWCGFQIQNIPRGIDIKSFIVSDPGWELAEADKAQAEARCVGYLSGETKLIDLVESPRDYHSWNASAFFGIPYEEIYDEPKKKTLNKELRDLSKRTNHGANYNMGGRVMLDTMGPKMVAKAKATLRLPKRMGLKDVCEYLLGQYAATYPRVKGLYYETIVSTIAATNRLVSPLGWTRYFFNKPSKANKPALNSAVAHPSQNLSVAIVNREWYAIWRETVYGKFRGLVRIKAQIHDSIFFQYKAGRSDIALQVQAMMQTSVDVTGADGVTRTMMIPADLNKGETRWSKLK